MGGKTEVESVSGWDVCDPDGQGPGAQWLEAEWAREPRTWLERGMRVWRALGLEAVGKQRTEPAQPALLCASYQQLHNKLYQNLVALDTVCYLSFCGSGMWLCRVLQLRLSREAAGQVQGLSGFSRGGTCFQAPTVVVDGISQRLLAGGPCHVGFSLGQLRHGSWFYQNE